MNKQRALVLLSFCILCFGCEAKVELTNPDSLPQVVKDTWEDTFPGREIMSIDTQVEGSDTLYTLYSGAGADDEYGLEVYVTSGDEPEEDVYIMVIAQDGTVMDVHEESLLSESTFPPEMLETVRAEFPDKRLVGMRRIINNDTVSFAVNVLDTESGENVEIVKYRFSSDGALLSRIRETRDRKVTLRMEYDS